MASPLISTAELATIINDRNLVIVDTRHDLMNPSIGRDAYAAAHLPGAIYLSIDEDLSGEKTNRLRGCGLYELGGGRGRGSRRLPATIQTRSPSMSCKPHLVSETTRREAPPSASTAFISHSRLTAPSGRRGFRRLPEG